MSDFFHHALKIGAEHLDKELLLLIQLLVNLLDELFRSILLLEMMVGLVGTPLMCALHC